MRERGVDIAILGVDIAIPQCRHSNLLGVDIAILCVDIAIFVVGIAILRRKEKRWGLRGEGGGGGG